MFHILRKGTHVLHLKSKHTDCTVTITFNCVGQPCKHHHHDIALFVKAIEDMRQQNEELLKKRREILGKSKLTAQDKKKLKRLELEMGDILT